MYAAVQRTRENYLQVSKGTSQFCCNIIMTIIVISCESYSIWGFLNSCMCMYIFNYLFIHTQILHSPMRLTKNNYIYILVLTNSHDICFDYSSILLACIMVISYYNTHIFCRWCRLICKMSSWFSLNFASSDIQELKAPFIVQWVSIYC